MSRSFRKKHEELHSTFIKVLRLDPRLLDGIQTEYRLNRDGIHTEHVRLGDFVYDFAWPDRRVLVELQGGIYTKHRRSGHVSIAGMERDMEKLNRATIFGWFLLQFSPNKIRHNPGYVIFCLRQLLLPPPQEASSYVGCTRL